MPKSKLRVKGDELFAEKFVVIANERKYDANHQNYFDFLNEFRSNIKAIEYRVQEYIHIGSTVVMPLTAIVKRLSGQEDIFDAIMLIKFDGWNIYGHILQLESQIRWHDSL